MAKPKKIEEPAGNYVVSPKPPVKSLPCPTPPPAGSPGNPDVRHADTASFRQAASKVFKTHDKLFRKLAQ
jgi:hypothetical protein